MISFPITGETPMKITIVHTPNNNKPAGKWCPWMIDTPVDGLETGKK